VENHDAKVKTGLALRDLIIKTETWPVAGSFRIARSSLTEISVVTVTLTEGIYQGRGECRPYSRYNETPDSVVKQIESIRQNIEQGLSTEDLQKLLPPGAARNAVDCALWDLKAKQSDQSVFEMLGIAKPQARKTAYTLSIDSPKKMRAAAMKAQAYPLLKVKIGSSDGLAACLAVMEARPGAELIIDANEALSAKTLGDFQSALSGKPVIMIEQPLPQAQEDLIPNTPNALPIFHR